MLYVFNSLVSWRSKLQKTVSLSSTQAEYQAVSEACREILWVLSVFTELPIPDKIKLPVLIMEDNQGCIAMAKNPVKHERNKHIDVKHHFIRDLVESGVISLRYSNTLRLSACSLTF